MTIVVNRSRRRRQKKLLLDRRCHLLKEIQLFLKFPFISNPLPTTYTQTRLHSRPTRPSTCPPSTANVNDCVFCKSPHLSHMGTPSAHLCLRTSRSTDPPPPALSPLSLRWRRRLRSRLRLRRGLRDRRRRCSRSRERERGILYTREWLFFIEFRMRQLSIAKI